MAFGAGRNGGGAQATALQMAMAARAQNETIRHVILHGGSLDGGNSWIAPAVNMWQAINPGLAASIGPGSVLTANIRPVGLNKKLWVQIRATVTAGATSLQTLGKLGIDQLVSNITVYDLANNTRINTTGWHLRAVANAKRRRTFGASYTTDMATIMGYGAVNNRINYAPATIAANGSTEIDLVFEVPFAYTDRDLRGALFASTTQATVTVQVTLNPAMFAASTDDPVPALYVSAGSDKATLSAVTWQVYQNYLDQLPQLSDGSTILPPDDISTAYVLTNTSSGVLVANQDNTIPFINQRRFQSLTFIYDNAGVLNVNGGDVNSVSIVSANFTNIYKTDGKILELQARDHMGSDMPPGGYYFDFRERPIDTDQYGNMQMVFNPSSVGSSAAILLLGWEAFGKIGQINQSGSMPSGA